MFARYLKIVFCVSLVILLLPISASLNGSDLDDQSGSEPVNHAVDLIPVASPFSDSLPARGSRAIINHVATNSNDPNDGATQFSTSGDQLRGDVGYNRLHWFMTSMFQTPSPSGKPYNLTISPSLSMGYNDWLIVRLYVFWDFDYDSVIDYENKEMILLHQESYSYSSSTWEPCWALTSHLGNYYVCVEGKPNNQQDTLSYSLTTSWTNQDPPENDINYDISKSLPITPNTALGVQRIDMDMQMFDWYVIDAPTDSEMFGINVTVRLKIQSPSPPIYSCGLGSSFVVELMVVILHELENDPSGDKIFGGTCNASKHKITKLPKNINYYNVQTWSTPSKKISKSYIGVFAVSYGLDMKTKEVRYNDYDLTDDLEDPAINSWLKYSFTKVSSEPVIRPKISSAKTGSLRTLRIDGKTYDTYIYLITYYSKANYPPLIMRVHIIYPDGETIIRDLKKANPYDENYRTNPEYIYYIDGLELGEGYFKFQVECWDRHTYATGSKVEREIYPGPYVFNNIPPQVRDTARSTIEMEEDDKPQSFKLKDFFIDVDNDELTYLLVDGMNSSTYTGNDLIHAQIEKNEKLKITPKENQFGNCFLELLAFDFSDEAFAKHEIEVIIVPVNDPPQIKNRFKKLFLFSEIWFNEDTFFADLNLHDVFWDPIEFDPLTFSVSGNTNIIVTIAENGSVNFTAMPNWYGVEALTFTATDPPGGTASDELKVLVESVNDAPIMNETSEIICYEESWKNMTFEAWDPADQDPLIFSTNLALALNLMPVDYTFNKYTGELNLYPPNRIATGKNYTVLVEVYDIPPLGKSIKVSQEVIFTVRNKWDPPRPKIVEPKNGDIFLNIESIEFVGICLDDDLKVKELNEKITYEWYSDIDGKFGTQDVVRDVVLSPGSGGQQHKITLKVSDGKSQALTYINIYITKQQEGKDSDGDGMPDYWEDRHHLNKYDESDADGDPDQDNYTNYEEFRGMDGLASTPDSTDPWDSSQHPYIHPPPENKEEDTYFWPVVGFLISILIIAILVMITSSFISRKVRRARDYSEKRRELEERIKKEERERDEIRYGIYSKNELEVLCHSCGTRNKVQSKLRPLAVTCEKCDKRGVIY